MPRIEAAKIRTALKALVAWKKKGPAIVRTFSFKNFVDAIKFVNRVAVVAEKAWHHPDLEIRWNKVTVTLTTHSEGGLTAKDFAMARRLDRLV